MEPAGPRPSPGERHAGVVASLGVLHLVLVCIFVWTEAAEASGGPAHRAMRTYKNLSGVFRDYRFFAPKVASDMRAGFFLEEPDGTSTFEAFAADNAEVGLRYHCLVASSMRNERLRDLMARSWSAVMLGSRPWATRVTVVAQAYELPTMAAFAAGQAPRWNVVYAGVFGGAERRAGARPAAAVAP